MAIRFYLESSGTPGITPDFTTGAWDDTDGPQRYPATTMPDSTAMTTIGTEEGTNDVEASILQGQWSFPLPGTGTIAAQVIKIQARFAEEMANNNVFMEWLIKVVASNGTTVRGYVIGSATTVQRDGTELATSLTNRGDSTTGAEVAWQSGDYLVFEVGQGGDPFSSLNHDADMRIGTSAASDLPEDDSTTTDLRPWVEFADLSFDEIPLAGNQPAATGTLTVKTFETLAGDQPAATGSIASQLIVTVALAGDQPAPTGALTQKYLISLTGDQPAPTGALTQKYFIALAGDQPAASGALSPLRLVSLSGDQPAPSGTVAGSLIIMLAGDQPAPSGALAAVLTVISYLDVDVAKTYQIKFDVAKTYDIEMEVAKTYEVEITMSNETVFEGTSMTITGTFKRVSDDAEVDPSSVTATAKDPQGTTTAYVYGTDSEVSKSATGIYKLTFVPSGTPNAEGNWVVQFEGDAAAPVAAVNQDTFTVKKAL